MKAIWQVILTALVLCNHCSVFAAEHGTEAEAVAMVHDAIAYMKANGKEKTIAEVNNPKGKFISRDLYITIFDMEGKNLAHGANPKLVGKNLAELKDVNGKFYMKERLEILKTKNLGWSTYIWPNPLTKELESKTTYFERYGDVFFNCGFYK